MSSAIFLIVITGSAIWVYLDATKNKIGKVKDKKGFFNLSAGAWGASTLGFWIISFPSYLIKRKALLEIAKTSPVEVKGRAGKTIVFVIVGGLWLLMTINTGPPSAATLDCESLMQDVLAISARDHEVNGYSIIKIYDAIEVSRSDEEITCRSEAAFTDASTARLNYRAYSDRDGAWMVEYQILP
jgi:hypothetical protein